MDKDIIVIGGGVVGCAVARLLSRYEVSVALLEGADDIAEGASVTNQKAQVRLTAVLYKQALMQFRAR